MKRIIEQWIKPVGSRGTGGGEIMHLLNTMHTLLEFIPEDAVVEPAAPLTNSSKPIEVRGKINSFLKTFHSHHMSHFFTLVIADLNSFHLDVFLLDRLRKHICELCDLSIPTNYQVKLHFCTDNLHASRCTLLHSSCIIYCTY